MIKSIFFDIGGVLMTVNKFEIPETARKLGVNEKRFMKWDGYLKTRLQGQG